MGHPPNTINITPRFAFSKHPLLAFGDADRWVIKQTLGGEQLTALISRSWTSFLV
jgi:hypothetical protein